MLILPDRNIPRAKFLLPVAAWDWRTPSQAQPKDQFGNENRTRFRVRARLDDGHVVWCGWFDDRADVDAFLWAIATDRLRIERDLWRLPSPWWDAGIGPDVTYDFATVTFLTSPTGSNQTYTSPSDWDNSANQIETLGAGGSGAAAGGTHNTGGGAGAYSKITNFSFATPGTTTATYQIGTGGASVGTGSNGNAGGVSWFNNASDPGVGTDNSKVGAAGGGGGSTGSGSRNGGTAGASGSSWGQTKFSGGRGGNLTGASGTAASGGGGAAGPSGVGGNGVDSASTGVIQQFGGGSANNGATAGAAAGSNPGLSGTEFDVSHGCGSGGGGRAVAGTSPGGAGGTYGGGGGGNLASGTPASGAGSQGLIVVSYTPIVRKGMPLFTNRRIFTSARFR